MVTTPDLLVLRLEALQLDIEKVRLAVERAQQRSSSLQEASKKIGRCGRDLATVKRRMTGLVEAMETEPEIAELLNDASTDLANELARVPELITNLLALVHGTAGCLGDAMATTVALEEHSTLSPSLNRRCNDLSDKLQDLKASVADTDPAQRREHWAAYQTLLDGTARPLFGEYVDFLGGLTMRDTGLDDRVCEMTDKLLARFTAQTQRRLPLPARQAALGSALDSLILLGFPEWSIWGIALVGHEIGLLYAHDQNDPDLVALVRDWVTELATKPARTDFETDAAWEAAKEVARHHAECYVHQVLADAFATYTLGLSYACAALLLRLSPRHDEAPRPDRPRDIDRARVIRMILTADGDSIPEPFGTFTDAVDRLFEIWTAGVAAHAGPGRAEAAVQAAQGPPPEDERLDDLTCEALTHFRRVTHIRPYDNERWKASEAWYGALRTGAPEPGWTQAADAVPDVLTAAWRMRLMDRGDATSLAEKITASWSRRPNGGRR